jgi:hypothetical protein
MSRQVQMMMELARPRIFAFDYVAAPFRPVEKPIDGQNTIIVSSLHSAATLNNFTHRINNKIRRRSRWLSPQSHDSGTVAAGGRHYETSV